MAASESHPDMFGLTVLFRKHKITVLVELKPHDNLSKAKENILLSLKSRSLTDINGDAIPEQPEDIELGVPVDRSNPAKGWKLLVIPEESGDSIEEVRRQNGDLIAFRFRDESNDDDSWDILIPEYGEYDEE
ncbi:uncharacterized protein N7483_000583 [Penicillium malachiteum]|uniref:uncharacterized protein n=1 Tax=Penicillium malachiteum TaxID=1324776 RepID=UPI0025475609|nr:uncharacterized protein N7483_000583 [Penicillium malachiteum]KAJ5735458.1 hypothetical protein N7483_000583 [Penicillium malachiteum]